MKKTGACFSLNLLLCFLFISSLLPSQNIDIDILRSINLNRPQRLDNTFIFITNTATLVSVAVPIPFICAGLFTENKDLLANGVEICASLITSSIITTSLKYIVNRPRPVVTYPDIEQVTATSSPSFPSGHTSSAFATATSLSLIYPKWYVIVPSFLWAGSVAYSRMDLGAHYPTDVLAGAIIGSGSAFLCYKANAWLRKKKE